MYVVAFRGQRSLLSPGTGVTGIARCLLGMLGPEPPGSLQEQYYVLLTTEQSISLAPWEITLLGVLCLEALGYTKVI